MLSNIKNNYTSNFTLRASINSELITYIVKFENNRDESIYNFLLNIYVPENTILCEKTIYINKSQVEDRYLYGIRVREFPKKSIIEVEYTVQLKKNIKTRDVYNKCKATFKTSENTINEEFSNIVAINENDNLSNGVKFYENNINDEMSINNNINDINEEFSNTVIVNIEDIKANSNLYNMIDEIKNYKNNLTTKREQTITYSTKIRNISTKYIEDIKLIVEEFPGVKVQSIYIKIHDELIKVDVNKRLDIEGLGPDDEIETLLNLIVEDDFIGSEIKINFNIEYAFINDENKLIASNFELDNIVINVEEETIDYSSEYINLSIDTDDKAILKGKEVSYSIKVDNTSCNEFKNSIISINHIDGSYIDKRKITIDNNKFDLNYIEVEEQRVLIHLGNLVGENSYKIGFKIDYSDINSNLDEAQLNIKLSGEYFSQKKRKDEEVIYERALIQPIENISLKVFIESDKKLLAKDDNITYKSTIINDGSLEVSGKYSLDTSSGIIIDKERVRINKVFYKNILTDNNIEFKLMPGEGLNIEIRGQYIRSYGKNIMHAKAVIDYECECNGKKISDRIKSEEIYTDAAITAFKEVVIEDTIDISNVKSSIKEIIRINSDVDINDFYVIANTRNTFNDTKVIGQKVRVRATLKFLIEYLVDQENQIVNLYYKEKIFSTTIQLPEDYIHGELNDVKAEIVDVYYKLISNESIFTSINMLISTNI
ncbi:MAG: hypothetical protein ACRDA3_07965 [Peptostreptococcaceae bacterium]